MFKNALVGVDGRPNGRDAITLASRLTDEASKVTLAHVHSGWVHPLHAVSSGAVAEELDASSRLLEEERSHAEGPVDVVAVEAATPGAGLHRRAEAQGADVIVVGSCSRSMFGRVMLGDDTRGALNGAPCAVAVAARGYAERPLPIAKIGVAYNGSPESELALAKSKELAEANRAQVIALEVVSIPGYAFTGLVPPAFGETVELMLSEASARMGKLEGVQGRAVYGLAGEELAAFGDEVDLLVVGSRGYGPLKRLVLGSTSDYLERHARCSLLVLPRVEVEVDSSTAASA